MISFKRSKWKRSKLPQNLTEVKRHYDFNEPDFKNVTVIRSGAGFEEDLPSRSPHSKLPK